MCRGAFIQGGPKVCDLPFQSRPERANGIRSLERTGNGRNFLLSKKNPEIKVPKRCRGYVRLKYIACESSLVTEQRVVIQFLTLKRLFARDVTAELEGVYGHEALSLSAVKKWRKRFVNGRITLEDDPWSGRPPRNNLYESLRALINEIPFVSCKRMEQNLRIPRTTCLRLLQGILIQKRLFKVASPFHDGERDPRSGNILP
jgi:hypothetical protein